MGGITKILTSSRFGETVEAIGTVATAAGQFRAAKSEAQVHETNVQISRFNAAVARQEAGLVEAKKELNTLRLIKQKKALTATQRAEFSKAGVILEGSPLEVIRDSEAEMELDILIDRLNSDIEASRFLSEAQVREREAAISGTRGRVAERTGRIRAGRTLLTGVTKIISAFGGRKKEEKIKPTTSFPFHREREA